VNQWLKRLARQGRLGLSLFLISTLLTVQGTGLHFHAPQSASSHEPQQAARVHAAHSDTHAACHEDSCDTDLSVTKFWKQPEQGWDIPALFAVAFVVVVLSVRLGQSSIPLGNTLPLFYSLIFLRPPLRAPPLYAST
jgi:hypothetical protein